MFTTCNNNILISPGGQENRRLIKFAIKRLFIGNKSAVLAAVKHGQACIQWGIRRIRVHGRLSMHCTHTRTYTRTLVNSFVHIEIGGDTSSDIGSSPFDKFEPNIVHVHINMSIFRSFYRSDKVINNELVFWSSGDACWFAEFARFIVLVHPWSVVCLLVRANITQVCQVLPGDVYLCARLSRHNKQ